MDKTIYIKTLKGHTIKLKVSLSNKIEEIKSRIQNKIGTHVNEQRLIFAGKQLENNRTLNDYEIKDESVLHLVLPLHGGASVDNIKDEIEKFFDELEGKEQNNQMQIIVKSINDEIIYLDVEPFETIEEIKYKIEEKQGYPPELQKLVYLNCELEDYKSLKDYKIIDKTTIYLVIRKNDNISKKKKRRNGRRMKKKKMKIVINLK